MEVKRRDRTILIIVIAVILLLLALLLCRGCSGTSDTPSTGENPTERSSSGPSPTGSTQPEAVNLEGRWKGSSSVLGNYSIVFEMAVPVSGGDETSQYVAGYVLFGDDPSGDPVAPLSGVANATGDGMYEVQIWSTNLIPPKEPGEGEGDQAHPVLFTGTMDTQEDVGEGIWKTGDENGDWQVEYSAGDVVHPVYDVDHSRLWIDFDVVAAIHTDDQNGTVVGMWTQLGVGTNIAVSIVVVHLPDGTEITLEPTLDIFNPGVDFVDEFGFAWQFEGLPIPGEYSFEFLDPAGEPLAGIAALDIWSGCEANAPLDVNAAVGANGITVSWSQVPGFDPTDPGGFYQVEFGLEDSDDKQYGSNQIQETSHLMPFAAFVPGSGGSPDGEDYGLGLRQLDDGTYKLVLYLFVPANRVAGGIGFECQLTAEDEWQTVEKSGDRFTVDK